MSHVCGLPWVEYTNGLLELFLVQKIFHKFHSYMGYLHCEKAYVV